MKNLFYGIDFGTSNTAVAFINDRNKPEVIPIDPLSQNPNLIRTIIYASRDGKLAFGQKAVLLYNKDVAQAKPAKKIIVRTGKLIKVWTPPSRKTGWKPDQIVEETFAVEDIQTGRLLQGIKNLLGKQIIEKVNLFGQEYTIEELIGVFLKEVKRIADKHTGYDVKKVVLGRPVQFVGDDNELAAERLIKAARIAGFTDVRLQLEPIGAAYDFGIDITTNKTVLVFDFGGGTLDLSIVTFPEKKIVINTGIPLGGDLINAKLFYEKIALHFGKGETYGLNQLSMPDRLYFQMRNWYAISLFKTSAFLASIENYAYQNSNPEKLNNLKLLVENNLGFLLYEEIDRVKKSLSSKDEDFFILQMPNAEISNSLQRIEFEDLIRHDLIEINELIDKTLKDANLRAEDIDEIAITGGSSLIPAVRNTLSERFGNNKLKNKDTFTSVASGLSLYAKDEFMKII